MLHFKKALTIVLFGCLCLTSVNAQFSSPAETGSAGVYDEKLHGSRTELGALYDQNQLTCAHKFYPTGTLLQVTRIDNGQSVVVEVNDRLSVKADEVVRVSGIAAQQLGLDPSRVTIVRLDPLGKPKNAPVAYYNTSPSAATNSRILTAKGAPAPQSYDAVVSQPPASIVESAPKLEFPSPFGSPAPTRPQGYDNAYARSAAPTQYSRITTTSSMPKSYDNLTARGIATGPGVPAQPSTRIVTRALPQNYDNLTARGISANTPVPAAYDAPPGSSSLRNLTTYYVQVAAFSKYANADRYYQDLVRRGITDANIMQVEKADGSMLYRMKLGPFPNIAEANKRKQALARNHKLRGLVVEGN